MILQNNCKKQLTTEEFITTSRPIVIPSSSDIKYFAYKENYCFKCV